MRSEGSPQTSAAAPAAASETGDVQQRYAEELAARHLTSDAEQRTVVARLDDLRRRLLEPLSGFALPRWLAALTGRDLTPVQGLYLWGGVGRGKTWLMDLFCATLPATLVRRRHFHRFMHEVHEQLGRLQHHLSPLEQVARRIARETRVLCLDELYVADIADAMILGGLFTGLTRRGVTLVATSNLPPRELYRDGLQRQRFLPAIALIERHLDVVRLAGSTDYRLRRLTEAGIYLPAGVPGTAERLAALFASLAGQEPGGGGSTIRVAGRAIPVVRRSATVAWFDFAALCAGARSQEDYIEIAREYQSVLVSGVPVFDAAHEDEARRYIALVDEFYDRNVKLIVSAAASPPGLYRGERLAAPFERTVSRLIEMQSAEYLAREHRP